MAWCMTQKPYSASHTDIRLLPVANRVSPSLQIEYGNVARYIAATRSLPISVITKEDMSNILLSEISYAPISLTEKLVGDREDNADQECMIAIVKLLVKGILPPGEQCSSILGIFLTQDGSDLTNELLESSTESTDCFARSLGKLSNEADKLDEVLVLASREELGRLEKQACLR